MSPFSVYVTVPSGVQPTAVSDDIRQTVAWPRFSMQVLGAFGVIALLLAAMGIYPFTSQTCAVGDVGGGVQNEFEAAMRIRDVYLGVTP